MEAARAGKAGMGFAVVTDEILKISDRTNESLKNITLLMSSNDKETNIGKDNATVIIDTISSMLTEINTISTVMDEINGHINKQPDANNLIKKTGNLKI